LQSVMASIFNCIDIVVHACKNITEKCICWKCLARKFGFVCLRFASKQLITWLDYNRYSQLTRWCSGNASALGARAPGFNPAPARVFMFDVLFCCCCVFILCPKTHYLSQQFAIRFTILFYLVYLTYCKICDRL